MSVDFNSVLGFYVAIGSTDFPRAWSLSKPFGFNSGDSNAVFESSFQDMLNLFDSPVTATKKFSAFPTNNNLVSSLTIERPTANSTNDDFDISKMSSDDTADIWCSIFKIVEYIFINQSTVTLSTFQADIPGILGVNPVPYVNNSIEFTRNANRISYVNFGVDFNAIVVATFDAAVHYDPKAVVLFNGIKYQFIGTSNSTAGQSPTTNPTLWVTYGSDVVNIKIYFNPDDLINNESADRYQVYVYEDEDGDNLISEQEWKDQIIGKTIDIFNTGHYKYYETLTTRFVYLTTTGVLVTTTQMFVVYTISQNFTNNQVINAIKEFLLTTKRTGKIDNGKIYSYQECVFHYPDLFLTRTINLVPIRNVAADNVTLMSPVSFNKIVGAIIGQNLVIDNTNIENSSNNVKGAEVIFVGGESLSVANPVQCPVLVYSSELTDDVRPVSQVYPKFAPIYQAFPGYGSNTDATVIFHHLVFLALQIVIGQNSSVNGVDAAIAAGFGFEINKTLSTNKITSVIFNYQGTVYIVNAFPGN